MSSSQETYAEDDPSSGELVITKPAPGERVIVHLDRQIVGVFNVAGTIYVYEDRCPHQGGPVCHGVVGDTLRTTGDMRPPAWVDGGEVLACPWHGMEFSLRSGKSLMMQGMRLSPVAFRDLDGQIALHHENATSSIVGNLSKFDRSRAVVYAEESL